jgi:alkylation response protein AidB-like acyl-CoA dehydrogenase
MDLSFGPDETMLRDTVRRYVEQDYGFEARQKRLARPDGWCRDTWRQMAEIGILAAPLLTEAGGLGLGAMGTLIVAEAFGHGLVVEPFVSTVVLGAAALQIGGTDAQRALLARVASGDLLLAFAHDEPTMRYEYDDVRTRAVPQAGGFRLHGTKSAVLHGATADRLIVTARLDGGADVAAFLVARDAPGLAVRRGTTSDGLPVADLCLDGVLVGADARLAGPADLVDRVLDRARAAACAEAAGIMDALLKRTIAYLGTRQQFGMPLARFQALQHRVADMAMEAEQARSMALVAAMHADDEDAATRRRYVSAASARMAQAAKFVAEQAVQLHGGIGMTDALDVSHYFRRLTLLARAYGDAPYHLDRYLTAAAR